MTLSLAEARRIAIHAQGLGGAAPSRATRQKLSAAIQRIGLVQLDYVNVLVPAHYLIPYSRTGAYERGWLDELVYHRRDFTEQWAHEASIVPVDAWPLLRHRRETQRTRPWSADLYLSRHPEYIRWVVEQIRERGPLCAADLPGPAGDRGRLPGTWYRSISRIALEYLFARGTLAVETRLPSMARRFDLAERVVREPHLSHRLEREAQDRELVRRAAMALGVATAADLADYWRMRTADVRPRLAELVAAGELEAVRVEGWREPAYLSQKYKTKPPERGVLLSPFDPLVWFRPRTERLFGFAYRLEIYTPEAQRRWGYYVLPFLLGDRLVARVDLKADRGRAALLVQAAWLEEGEKPGPVAEALQAELRRLAGWLGLEKLKVARRGTLAPALRSLK